MVKLGLTMLATAEILSFIVRVGPECGAYGQPWAYCVTCSSVDGKTVVVKALKGDGGFTNAHRRAIAACIYRLGFRTITWDRVRRLDAEPQHVTLLPPPSGPAQPDHP